MWRALSVLVTMVALTAQADAELGAQLPEGSRKVAEHRYRSSSDFEGTIKFYKKTYPDYTSARKKIVNQPGVNAWHIPNTSGKGAWEGLNIYEANDEVRIFVVPAKESGSKKPKK
ncbi:MAG: hypothetical protein Q8L48_34415 [Archangium sp.]|nr:hypothetical protein [Archangium sp.]